MPFEACRRDAGASAQTQMASRTGRNLGSRYDDSGSLGLSEDDVVQGSHYDERDEELKRQIEREVEEFGGGEEEEEYEYVEEYIEVPEGEEFSVPGMVQEVESESARNAQRAAALDDLKQQFSEAEWAELKEVFDLFDTDHDGQIALRELDTAMRAYGNDLSADELRDLVAAVDRNRDGSLQFDEFVVLMVDHMAFSPYGVEQQLRDAFSALDSDGSGVITRNEFHCAFEALGIDFDEEEIDALIGMAGVSDVDAGIPYAKLAELIHRPDTMPPILQRLCRSVRPSPREYIEAFLRVPSFFRESRIRQLHDAGRLRISDVVLPKTNRTQLFFDDFRLDTADSGGLEPAFASRVRPRNGVPSLRMHLSKAVGVPLPPHIGADAIVRRAVRMCLFDLRNRSFYGNAWTVQASWSPSHEDRWIFPSTDSNGRSSDVVVRTDMDNENLAVYLEFCITLRHGGTRPGLPDQLREMSVGWTMLGLKNPASIATDVGAVAVATPASAGGAAGDDGVDAPVLAMNGTGEYVLDIRGGTYEKPHEIDPSEVIARRKGWRRLVASKPKPTITMDILVCRESKKEQFQLLPRTLVCPVALAPLIVLYREICADVLYSSATHVEENALLQNFPVVKWFGAVIADADACEALLSEWYSRRRRWKKTEKYNLLFLKMQLNGLIKQLYPALRTVDLGTAENAFGEGSQRRFNYFLAFLRGIEPLIGAAPTTGDVGGEHYFKPFSTREIAYDVVGNRR